MSERAYLDLLQDVLDNGVRKTTRAILKSTGEKIDAISVFGRQIRFDLRQGFPLLTTKRIHFDSVFWEMAWFLRGGTNVRFLQEHGVSIWDEWADEDGELGPIYGKQWRSWDSTDGSAVDQIADMSYGISCVSRDPGHPAARRLVVSAWNVAEIDHMKLPPCHFAHVWNVTDGLLSCHMIMRSTDLFLGLPYNIASYALMTHLMARVTSTGVGDLVISMSDAHIYANHIDQVREQLGREPRPFPTLTVDNGLDNLVDLRREQVNLIGYNPHPTIKGEVAV